MSRNWWRVGDAVVLTLYSCVILFTVRYHEKWADEAQAWLIARDLSLKSIWFRELRYEGSPGLWHTILWVAQHVFHAGYGSLGYIGVACAIAGAAVLVFVAPFPRYLRWPLAFTYVIVYQYAVIARPYTLLPLFAFAAALVFKDVQHPERITIALFLLAMLTLHGTIIAACLALAFLIDVIKAWPTLEPRVRHNFIICVGVMTLTFLFIAVILKPTADVAEFAPKDSVALQSQVSPAQKMVTAVCGAFLDSPLPSFAFLVLVGAWCAFRGRLLVFALPIVLLTALYGMVHGYAHHQGTIFIAAITALWIAWPTERERLGFDPLQRGATLGVTALILVLCQVNISDAAVAIEREYRYPYSGAEDAARYLKSVGADREPMFGYLFGVVAIQAYFDHNIFANLSTAYFHLGLQQKGTTLNVDEIERVRPLYIVAYSIAPNELLKANGPVFTSLGYELVHFSDGYYLYKRGVYQRESYLIFRRATP